MLLADKPWGERSALTYTWVTKPEMSTHQSFESDAPAKSPNPFLEINAAVTRRLTNGLLDPNCWPPEQSLIFQEVIESFTTRATYAAYIENLVGKLAKGYLADSIVLEKDPFICNLEEMKILQSSATMVGSD